MAAWLDSTLPSRRPSLHGALSCDDRDGVARNRAQDLQRAVAGVTGGEGILDANFAGYQPVTARQPRRDGYSTDERRAGSDELTRVPPR